MSPLPPSAYLEELLAASRRYPRVALVLIQLGTGKLHLLMGNDPHLGDQLDAYLRIPFFPVCVLGFSDADHVTVEPVAEWKNERWAERYALQLAEQVRKELDRAARIGL